MAIRNSHAVEKFLESKLSDENKRKSDNPRALLRGARNTSLDKTLLIQPASHSHKPGGDEFQTATQSQTVTKSENAKERFIRKTRELFAKETDLDKRWNALRPILAELLADPKMPFKERPDCVPANGRAENLLYLRRSRLRLRDQRPHERPGAPRRRRADSRPRSYLHALRRP